MNNDEMDTTNTSNPEEVQDSTDSSDVPDYLPAIFAVVRLILACAMHHRLGANSLLYLVPMRFNSDDTLVRLIADDMTEFYVAWPLYQLFSEFVEHRMILGRLYYNLSLNGQNVIAIFDDKDRLIVGLAGRIEIAEAYNQGEVLHEYIEHFQDYISASIVFGSHLNLTSILSLNSVEDDEEDDDQTDGEETTQPIQTWTLHALNDNAILVSQVQNPQDNPHHYVTEAVDLDDERLLIALRDILTVSELPVPESLTVSEPPVPESHPRCSRCNIPLPKADGAAESDLCVVCWRRNRNGSGSGDGGAAGGGAAADGGGGGAADGGGGGLPMLD
jgi:uncharacterized membrane protein YgcG